VIVSGRNAPGLEDLVVTHDPEKPAAFGISGVLLADRFRQSETGPWYVDDALR